MNGALVDAATELMQILPEFPETVNQLPLTPLPQVSAGANSEGLKPLGGGLAHTPDFPHRQRGQEIEGLIREHLKLPVGLPPVACNLGEELVRSDPRRGGQAGFLPDPITDFPSDRAPF